jgi:hypothetical protein
MFLVLPLLPTALVTRDARASFGVSAAGSSGAVDVSFFYDDLRPYGRWIDYPTYGYCWVPGAVVADWRPYWYGHWVYTDVGWTWASDEPWGWAVYHYGRWFYDPAYGWVWVPGTMWGPAWVDWRWSDECVGWAPLPPSAGWGVWGGLSFHDPAQIPVRGWSFVEPRSFVSVDLRGRVFPAARNEMFFRHTRDITRIGVHNGRPTNTSVAVNTIEQRARQRVSRLKVVDVQSGARGRGQYGNHGSIGFFRPEVRRAPGRVPQERNARAGLGTVVQSRHAQSPDARRSLAPQSTSREHTSWQAVRQQREQPHRASVREAPSDQPRGQPGVPRTSAADRGSRPHDLWQRSGQDRGPRPAPQPPREQPVAQRHAATDRGGGSARTQGGHDRGGLDQDKRKKGGG